MKIVTITDIRKNISEIVRMINDPSFTDEAVIIVQHGKPVAVLLSFVEYNLLDMSDRLVRIHRAIELGEARLRDYGADHRRHLEEESKKLEDPPSGHIGAKRLLTD